MQNRLIDYKVDTIQETVDIMVANNPAWSYWDFLSYIKNLLENPSKIPPVYSPLAFEKQNYYMLMDYIRVSLQN